MDVVDALKKNPAGAEGLPKDIVGFGEALGAGPDHTFDEDCLTLNVWAKPQTGEKKKAVLVWIYGGGKLIHSPVESPAS
jgi:carboxylesterase type B